MARAHAKTNPTSKSAQKTVSPPPPAVTAPNTTPAPVVQAQAQAQTPKESKTESKPTIKESKPAEAARATPSHEQIARRAYELYLARGGEHGRHDDDWSQAERDLALGC